MKTLALLLAASLAVTDFSSAVEYLSGASSIEELDSSSLELYTSLQAHPLDLNAASAARLSSCGLFSPWQAASIADYRARSGDILSFTELASIDGIGEEMARALRHFVVLRTARAPGRRAYDRLGGEGLVKLSGTQTGGGSGASGGSGAEALQLTPAAKVRFSWGERAQASVSYKGDALTSWSAEWYGRGHLQALTVGDFNVRLGQGLLLWSGFSMSGVPTVAAFAKSPSFASAANSFSGGGFRGIAARLGWGTWTATAFAARNSIGGNVFWLGHSGQISVSGLYQNGAGGASADFRWGFPGWLIFGEAAVWSHIQKGAPSASVFGAASPASANVVGSSAAPFGAASPDLYLTTAPAGILGAVWSPKYGVKFSVLGRAYHPLYAAPGGGVRSSTKTSDELGAALGASLPTLNFTADAAYHPSKGTSQHKSILTWSPRYHIAPKIFSDNPLTSMPSTLSLARRDWEFAGVDIKPSLRLCERWRPADKAPWRHDLRADLVFTSGSSGSGAHGSGGLSSAVPSTGASGTWTLAGRFNIVHSVSTSWLWYAELGYKAPSRTAQDPKSVRNRASDQFGTDKASKSVRNRAFDSFGTEKAPKTVRNLTSDPFGTEKASKSVRNYGAGRKQFSVWGRFEMFKVDNWEDRIYVYEREAPGNFNVPSCYGRGCRASLLLGWRGLYLRASRTWYPWIEKAPKTELRLQYSWRF